MNTFDERISSAVKNWWVSLLLGLLYILIAICLMFTPMASYVALSLLFSVAMFVSGTLEILFCRVEPEAHFELGLVSGRRYYRPDTGYLPHGQSGTEYDRTAVYPGVLVDVQRLFFHRLCYGPETVRNRKLGLVYGFRYPGNHL